MYPDESDVANVDTIIVDTTHLQLDNDTGSGYKSLKNQSDNDNDNALSPNVAARGSAWPSLERRGSDQSTQYDFELEPVNDRTGLTRTRLSPVQDSQEDDILTGGDVSNNTHLQPPGNSPQRRKGFHHNPSLISGNSSNHTRSTRSSAPGSKFSSMKQALGRASTRVVNLSGSSRSQPSTLENTSMYSRRSIESTEGQEEDDQQSRTSTGNLEEPVRTSSTSRTSLSLIAEAPEDPINVQWVDPPLEGMSLFIFGPDNPLRKKFNQFLNQTLELTGRIIVCGLVLYPKDGDKLRKIFGKKPRTDNLHDTNPTILRKTPDGQKRQSTMSPATTFINREQTTPPHNAAGVRATTIIDFAIGRQTTVTQYIPQYLDPLIAYTPQFVVEKAQIPFLRHTFNRIDLIAVICYWIDIILMAAGIQHVYFFKTIAAMRTLRLLNITPGSSTILHSLKKSAPLLVNILLFIVFFFIIFSIIGVQTFKGSFSRRCMTLDMKEPPVEQFCGGYIDFETGVKKSYITNNNTESLTGAKGYICSPGFVCADIGKNLHGTVSFDTIYSAMVPVYVLMTGQTWTDLMYNVMDAEYSWSSLYFVLVVLVMNFWILNLFVAVINEMFAKIRDDSTNNSAFKSDSTENKNSILNDSVNNFNYKGENLFSRRKKWVESLECIWVAAVIADLVFQCLPHHDTPTIKMQEYDRIEFWFTVAFAVDIIIRFLVWLPEPKGFFQSERNLVDLFLAVITLIIQIPPIHQSRVYVYLTIFQVVRIYRPIIYVERLRSLIQRVVGSWVGLLNLIFFIVLFLGVVSVMAALLFREVLAPEVGTPNQPDMTFQDFYVSYLGMYQIFSGENWTTVLYSVMSAEAKWHQVIISTVFIIAFYSFANFVLVNMLIAIIMENFEGEGEVAKHIQQIHDFAAKSGYSKEEERKFVIYLTKYLKPYPKSIGLDIMKSGWIHKMRKGLARQFLLGDSELFHNKEKDPLLAASNPKKDSRRRESALKNEYGFAPRYGPLNEDELEDTEHFRKLYSTPSPGYEEVDSSQESGVKSNSFFSRDSLRHRSLFIFGPTNKLRLFLQRLVTPARGRLIEGERDNVSLRRPFNLFITIAILASVIVAAITTPAWRLNQSKLAYGDQSVIIRVSDVLFPAIFTVEFVIRIIADGFIFTPDAYMKSLWNRIDLVVLCSLYVPLITNIAHSQGYSRFFRSLKSLRALRLINQSAYIKGTFHAVLVAGFPQLLSAGMLSISLIVPFAIYGMRLFRGQFYACNDTSISINTINDCVGTFVGGDSNITMPRVWSNPDVYSFDNFFSSFLILFEIVSQEGWTGVMATARNVAGLGMQPVPDASRYNAIFFVLFNLAGGYFVLSLFVAIVIENYTKRTGTAFMTANQRRWMDLKKLLGGIKMSKGKTTPPSNAIRALCFRLASPKRGWFPRLLTVVTILNGIMLMTEYVNSGDWEGIKNWIFMALLLFYMMEIFVRISGLGWTAFTKNRWNIYNSVVSTFALVITIARLGGSAWQPLIQTQKLFLTAILFRLVPQINSLNQLFMTMAASINSIASLFGVWLVVFAVYGIMFVEIFGLTAYGPNGDRNVNFRNIGNAMLMMARMSTGEGWNDLMHDFAIEKPLCVDQPENYLESDCGSTGWSYTLFMSFIIISMYIFTNMFIVVVMHNFSYVYQIAPGFSLINREEIRDLKKAWASVDTDRTGFIQEKDLTRFLMSLRGVFDVRIYNEEHSIPKLQSRLETIKPNAVKLSARELEKNAAGTNQARKVLMLNETNRRTTVNWDEIQKAKAAPAMYGKLPDAQPSLTHKIDQDYNLEAFNSAIANINKEQVRYKRKLFNFLYTEAVMSMEPIPGTEHRKKRFFHWRSTSHGSTSNGAGVGGPLSGNGDYEMGQIGDKAPEAQYGISFQKMLDILAHYKLIEDDQCLSIGDMLRHRQKMDRIHARVNVIYVKSILLKMILRQRFLKHYDAVKKIHARTDSNSMMQAEYPPEDPIEPIVAAGVGSNRPMIPTITRSVYPSEETSQTAANSQKRVRINTGDSQTEVAGISSSLSVPGETTGADKEELVDSEQAGAMISNLRSEWRSYISNHDLSMESVIQGQQPMGIEVTRDPTVNDFENVGMRANEADPNDQHPRNEVLGRDYL
ncbi:calcium channel protein [Mortierella sp. AM989]|nr:calcium channel protein [Mortierella sp. AM989]